MKSARIRIIFLLATLCTIGILGSQIFGLRRAYYQEVNRFNQNVNQALRDAASGIWLMNQSLPPNYNYVQRLNEDYYLVQINENVDSGILEHYLKESFTSNDVYSDFVFGLHDCLNHNFKYIRYASMGDKRNTAVKFRNYPEFKPIDNYYFVVYFPYRSKYLSGQMTIWLYSSVILIFTLFFLAYIIYVVLSQRRLTEMQKDFVKNMTHEFKTPLTSIQLASTVLKKPDIINNPTKLFNYATIIDTEARKLELQVERVLQMSTGQKRELQLNLQLLDIRELINETAESYSAQLEDRDGELITNMSKAPVMIFGDADHLKTAFSNLIDNALKYTPEHIKPKIDITIKDIYKNEIHIIIKDNGIGIEKSNIKLIFERFYRVSTGNVHNVKGFGIGLNYVKSIISLHNGKIHCESTVGNGTSFIIILPKPKSK